MRTKRREMKTEPMRRRHRPIPEQGRWLASLRGHVAYYAVPGNIDAVVAFRTQGGTGTERFGIAVSAAVSTGAPCASSSARWDLHGAAPTPEPAGPMLVRLRHSSMWYCSPAASDRRSTWVFTVPPQLGQVTIFSPSGSSALQNSQRRTSSRGWSCGNR